MPELREEQLKLVLGAAASGVSASGRWPSGAKAHGHAPEWAEWNKLAPGSRAALRTIDLHFHDLRHECGSRLLEGGVPLHHVQAILGHENLSQTSTYLNATRIGVHESMRRFDDARCTPVAQTATTEHPPLCNADATREHNSLVN